MVDHQCSRAEDIATIKTIVAHLDELMHEHHKSLYGNGRPGLDDRMSNVEHELLQLKNAADEIRKAKNQIITAILIAILSAWVAGLVGCTYAHVGDATYISVLQKKSGSIKYDPTDGTVDFIYTSDSDPAIEAIKQGVAIGAAAAAKP